MVAYRRVYITGPATTEIYTLSLHDALPICSSGWLGGTGATPAERLANLLFLVGRGDRKSTRLNSSHVAISYAVFCLKKKKKDFGVEMARESNQIVNFSC